MKAKTYFSGGLLILYFLLGVCMLGNLIRGNTNFKSKLKDGQQQVRFFP